MKIDMPKSHESEAALLGALLLDCRLFKNIKTKLCSDDFFYTKHQKLYQLMGKFYWNFRCFDVRMLADEIEHWDTRELNELANNCASVANVNAYADIIREKSVQRQLIAVATDIAKEALGEGKKDLPAILNKADEQVNKIAEAYEIPVPCSAKAHLVSFLRELTEEIDREELSEEYLREILVEVNKAFVSTLEHYEENHIEIEEKQWNG